MPQTIQPAVVGATGYAGFELARLLARHPYAKKPVLFTRNGEAGTTPSLMSYIHMSAAMADIRLNRFAGKLSRPKASTFSFWPRRTKFHVSGCRKRLLKAFM